MSFTFLLIITLIALRLFGAMEIPGFLILGLFAILSFKNIRTKSNFRIQVLLLVLFCIVSAYTCNYFRGQDIFATLKQASPYIMLFSYFFFIGNRITIAQLEKLIYTLTAFFIVCYLVQYALYPLGIVIFPDAETKYIGEIRIRLYGQNICALGFLFAINKFLIFGNKKYLILAFFSFFTMFLWGFRTITFASAIFAFIIFYRVRGGRYLVKAIPIFIIIVFLLLQIPIVSEKISFMLERQNEGQTFANDDYIRMILINYFYEQHFSSGWEMFWGSGLPADSIYGEYIEGLGARGMHWNDMGLLGLSWVLGIPATLTMLWYALKAVMTPLPPKDMYLSMYFFFLLLVGFTTAEFIRIGNYIPQAIALAMIAKIKKTEEYKK